MCAPMDFETATFCVLAIAHPTGLPVVLASTVFHVDLGSWIHNYRCTQKLPAGPKTPHGFLCSSGCPVMGTSVWSLVHKIPCVEQQSLGPRVSPSLKWRQPENRVVDPYGLLCSPNHPIQLCEGRRGQWPAVSAHQIRAMVRTGQPPHPALWCVTLRWRRVDEGRRWTGVET